MYIKSLIEYFVQSNSLVINFALIKSLNRTNSIMKRIISSALIFISVCAYSQSQNPEKFFSKQELMTIGSYYYSEQWPQEHWAGDIKKMAEVGFELTHFGEFAWIFI